MTNATLDNNTAAAGFGGVVEGYGENPGTGGPGKAYGGGMYAFGTTVAMTNATLDANAALGEGGETYGGGLYLTSFVEGVVGTATLTNCTVMGNSAQIWWRPVRLSWHRRK